MTDYEQFLLNKESITEAFQDAIMKTLSTMTTNEIKQLDWFSYSHVGKGNAKI